MPLDYPSTYTISLFNGKYNMYDESFDMLSNPYYERTNGSVFTDYYGTWYSYNNLKQGDMISVGLSLGSPDANSSISIPDGSLLSIFLNNIYFGFNINNNECFLNPSSSVPYRVYADMYFTAMQQFGNTHSGTYHTQTVDITNFLRSSSNPVVEGRYFDLDLNVPISADTSGFTGDRLYNINLRYIKIYAVYDFSQVVGFNEFVSFGDSFTTTFFVRNLGSENLKTSRISVNYSPSQSSDSSTLNANIIQSSIASIGSSISTQITQVKTSISQSTNTITTKIDTMANDVKTGLQNVVTSAQQNTQNIINTVTQKVDQVKTGITEVKDSIVDLPNKLEEKAISLVVPEQDVLESKFNELEELLRSRFGLIYQAEEVVVDFANSLQTSTMTSEAAGGKIIFPTVAVNLPNNVVFNFGGYEVDLVPDGFEFLQDAVRLAINMICTVVFINMCKLKLEVIFK